MYLKTGEIISILYLTNEAWKTKEIYSFLFLTCIGNKIKMLSVCLLITVFILCSGIASHSTNYIALIAGLVCILALLLPTQQEVLPQNTKIPSYLHLTMNLKIVFAYVLGLVSMVIFRP